MRNAALCLLLTWQGESSSCHDKTMWCVSPSINNNPRFNATCSFELDELTRLCKASPALTHQSASCCPMQPDDSVEALSVYSTASALQSEGAPECDDFEWLWINLNDFDTSKLLLKTSALLPWRPSWLSNAIGDLSSHILKLLKRISLLLIILEQLGYPGIGPCLKFRSILSGVVGGFHFRELKQYQTQQVYSLMLRNVLLHCKVRYRNFPLSLALQLVVSFENSSRRIQKDFVPQVHRRLLWT